MVTPPFRPVVLDAPLRESMSRSCEKRPFRPPQPPRINSHPALYRTLTLRETCSPSPLSLSCVSHVTQSVGCDEHRLPAALRPQTAPRRSAESTTQRQRRPSRLAAAAFSSLTRMKRPAQTAEPEEGTLTSQAWRPRPRPLSPQQSLRPTQPPQGAAEARREASGRRRRHSACPPTLPRWLVRRRGRLVRRRGRRRRRRRRRRRWLRRHWRRQRGRRRSGS